MRAATHDPRNLERVKLALWAVVGVWTVVTIARFATGLGGTSALTDVAPWGFWIAFDVMAGVALAAGGFVIAAAVYIFGLERYHQFARPAILTALLGYIAVAVGLLYDLGIPWHIWHPLVMPQHHSVLFEVAMCVMLYLTVLALEFSPAVLEHPMFNTRFFRRLLAVVTRLTVPLVIAGIVLSTLHQSSLGSLFLIQPFRVHPLWYSPIIYVLFFVSAVGLGLMMVTLESLISAWLFGHRLRVDLLAGLGWMASIVLSVYVLLRVGDLWYRGILPDALDGSWQSGLFLVELAISAIVPAILLSLSAVRESVAGLLTCALMTVFGIIGYRFDVCMVTFERPEGMSYFPSWIELAVSAGIVSAAALVFVFFNEHLRISHTGDHAAPADGPPPQHPAPPDPDRRAQTRRHSLAFVLAAAAAFGLLPREALFGPEPRSTPVRFARAVQGLAVPAPEPQQLRFFLSSLSGDVTNRPDAVPVNITVIDGNRDWRLVPFTHDRHVDVLGGRESCRLCHHQNLPFDQNSACYHCHRDMYEVTDTFDHPLHVARLDGNRGCRVCHEPGIPKTRETSLACLQCHGDMLVRGAIIEPVEQGLLGFAPGYVDAMHGLCIGCHEQRARSEPDTYGEWFARCDVCHRDFPAADQKRLAPYVPMPPGHTLLGTSDSP